MTITQTDSVVVVRQRRGFRTPVNELAAYIATVLPPGGGGSTAWADITDKPSAFPPEVHVHTIGNVTGLQSALDGKQAAGSYAASVHGHVIADVTGLQTALDGKQPLATVLTNTTAAFTTAQETKLAGIATAATANASDSALRDRATHTGAQAISTVTGLQDALDAKQATLVSATNIKSVNGASLLGSGDLTVTGSDPWTYAKLSSAVTNSSTTATNITGLAFTPAANTQYEFEAMLLIQAAVATTGVRPGVTWPTGLSDGIAFAQSAASATAFTFALGNNAAAVQANAANIPGADQSYPGRVMGTLIAGATPSGVLQLTVASEVGSSEVRIMPGSFLKWRVV